MQYAVHEYFMNKRFVSVRRVEEEGEGMKGLVEGGRGGGTVEDLCYIRSRKRGI